jgi:uncharacterized membrane protein YeaQ/YmgE (transglycosylase-associated protein family)
VKGGEIMSFLLWIVLGALAGWIASIVMRTDEQQGWLMNIVMGIVGAFVGGLVMNLLGQPGVTGFDLYSILVAIGGAVLLIWLSRTFMYR